jgi:hypothetical protein
LSSPRAKDRSKASEAQAAKQPEHQQYDQNRAQYAAKASRAILTMGVIAAAAAEQENQDYNKEDGAHIYSPVILCGDACTAYSPHPMLPGEPGSSKDGREIIVL